MRNMKIGRCCLEAITRSMETGEGNLLELAVEAARARASKGESSDMTKHWVIHYYSVLQISFIQKCCGN